MNPPSVPKGETQGARPLHPVTRRVATPATRLPEGNKSVGKGNPPVKAKGRTLTG